MSTPPEHRPTEPQPVVSTSTTPTASAPVADPPASRSRVARSGGAYDPVSRIALVVIAALLVIWTLLILGGFKFHVSVDKDKGGGGKNHSPKVSQSP